MEKTFLVTITYDENENPHAFTDENLTKNIEVVTEASFVEDIQVNARRAYTPAEIEKSKSEPISIH